MKMIQPVESGKLESTDDRCCMQLSRLVMVRFRTRIGKGRLNCVGASTARLSANLGTGFTRLPELCFVSGMGVPAFARHGAFALFNRYELTGRDPFQRFDGSARPMNLNIADFLCAKTEVES